MLIKYSVTILRSFLLNNVLSIVALSGLQIHFRPSQNNNKWIQFEFLIEIAKIAVCKEKVEFRMSYIERFSLPELMDLIKFLPQLNKGDVRNF